MRNLVKAILRKQNKVSGSEVTSNNRSVRKDIYILIKRTNDGLLVNLKIVPNSSKNEIILEEEFIKVKVTAQPIENKANKALIEFLSKNFKIPKTSIEIVKGETSKEKTLLFKNISSDKMVEIKSFLT